MSIAVAEIFDTSANLETIAPPIIYWGHYLQRYWGQIFILDKLFVYLSRIKI